MTMLIIIVEYMLTILCLFSVFSASTSQEATHKIVISNGTKADSNLIMVLIMVDL